MQIFLLTWKYLKTCIDGALILRIIEVLSFVQSNLKPSFVVSCRRINFCQFNFWGILIGHAVHDLFFKEQYQMLYCMQKGQIKYIVQRFNVYLINWILFSHMQLVLNWCADLAKNGYWIKVDVPWHEFLEDAVCTK